MSKKRALITGIYGQGGVHLCDVLGNAGYEIYGLVRRHSDQRLDPRKELIYKKHNAHMIYGDLTDYVSIIRAIEESQPDEIYNLGSQSLVSASWDIPIQTMQATGLGAMHIFEAVRQINKDIRIYQASSSEMFGKVQEIPQVETTVFYPRSPYSVAKCMAHNSAVVYRESYDMFITCGIMFNYEGPFRGPEFVTRKITLEVARMKRGLSEKLVLGNLDAFRDWGYAGDYMRAAYMMLQQDAPDDYVIATGKTHAVYEFVGAAFAAADVSPDGRVGQDSKFMRPAEVPILQGDPSKAKEAFGWEPSVDFNELVEMMVRADLEYVDKYEV